MLLARLDFSERVGTAAEGTAAAQTRGRVTARVGLRHSDCYCLHSGVSSVVGWQIILLSSIQSILGAEQANKHPAAYT
jgi:hypothetical protein